MAEWSSNSLSFPFGEPSPSPTTTFPRLNDSLPFQNGHFSSSFSSSLSSPIWGEGRGRPKTAGPVRPIRGSTGCQGAAIGWLGGQAASRRAWPHLPQRPPPIRRGPFTPKVPPKTQPTWHSASSPYSECRNLLPLLTNTRSQLKILDIQHN